MKYEVQGGVKNYLGKQKEVMAPLKWKSSPNHPETELAYITKKEKDLLVKKDLHGSLKGGVNRGPSGIMSLNGFGSADEDQNVSGSQMSAAETGDVSGFSGTGRGPDLPPGVERRDQLAEDIRSAAINAGAGQRVNAGFFDSRDTVSPEEMARAKAFARDRNNLFASGAMRNTRGGGLMNFFTSGGILGNTIRGIGQKFGLGKSFDEPTYDMRGLDSVNPEYYNDTDNELMLSMQESPVIPQNNTGNKVPIANTFVRPIDQRMTAGVTEGPYKNMLDYLEYDDGSRTVARDPITFSPSYPDINMADGIVNTDAFTSADGLGIYDGS